MRILTGAYIIFGLIMMPGCGGGGGGTPAAPVVQLPPGTTMTLEVDIAQGIIVNSNYRMPQASRLRTDATPMPPQVLFGVPDSYIKFAPREFDMSAYVYLDLPPGATFPSPAPEVTWTQVGSPLTVSDTSNLANPNTGLLGLLDASASQTTGETRLTATVVGAGSAEVDIYNYHAFGIACTANGLLGGTYSSGLSFDATGTAVPQATLAASDVALVGAPCSGSFQTASPTVSIFVPNGSTQPFPTSSTQTSFVGLTTTQFANPVTSIDPSTLAVVYSSALPNDKLLFKTR